MLSEFKHDLQSFSHTKIQKWGDIINFTIELTWLLYQVIMLYALNIYIFVSQLNILNKLFYLKISNKNTLNFKFLFA